MIIKNLPQIGNPILRKKAEKVTIFNTQSLKRLVKDLADSMVAGKMIGIAAPQLGKSKQVVVVQLGSSTTHKKEKKKPELFIFVNPKITWKSEKQVSIYEGCGSVLKGKIYGPVERPKEIVVSFRDVKGKRYKMKADGLLARVILHECDHLAGILFTDLVKDNRKLIETKEYIELVNSGKINEKLKLKTTEPVFLRYI